MKKMLLIILMLATFTTQAQLLKSNLVVDGVLRTYAVHLPTGYAGESGLPLVINMHGLGSNATEQAAYSRFNSFANIHNFIVVYPEGLEADVPDINFTGQHWNAYFETGVDDVGFLDLLIDVLWNAYEIDISRVYATGMSNGGYMSYTLACELPDRIAALASVTGTMVDAALARCNTERPMPVLQFHGTEDPVVDYNGFGRSLGIEEVMEFWTDANGCSTEGIDGVDLEDRDPGDNSTVTLFEYSDCPENGNVTFYRINNGGHTWPGAFIDVDAGPTNKDIDGTNIIWEFFSSFTHPNPRTPEIITSLDAQEESARVYPTLFSNQLYLHVKNQTRIYVYGVNGQWKTNWQVTPGTTVVNTTQWPNDVYILRLVENSGAVSTVKLIK